MLVYLHKFKTIRTKMNKFKVCLLILSICYCFFSCNISKKLAKTSANYLDQGFVSATIKKHTIDGCDYMLFLDDKMLNPINLENSFKKEGLLVWVKYIIDKKTMSNCMAGPNIIITDIIKN